MNKLDQYFEKNVIVTLKNGKVFKGSVGDVLNAYENTPPENSVVLDIPGEKYPIELFEKDIRTIAVV